MIERIYAYFVLLSSSNRKYELLPIVWELGYETMVHAVCLSIILWDWSGVFDPLYSTEARKPHDSLRKLQEIKL